MRPSERRKYRADEELSPREKRELIERGEWIEESDEDTVKKAPMPLRLLAWVSLIAIFFAIGYGATSMIFRWMDRGNAGRHPNNLVATQQEAEKLIVEVKSADETNAARDNTTLCTLSIPDGEVFVTRQIPCNSSVQEDNIQQVLTAYIDEVIERKLLDPTTQNLNIFQSGDWLYINMNGSFLTSLKTLGADKSRLLLTGLVKTVSDNFSPINKVKFYVGGREIKGKDPVDLSMPWSLSGKS